MGADLADTSAAPDGIIRRHIAQTLPSWASTAAAFLVFGTAVGIGLGGLVGGHPSPVRQVQSPATTLTAQAPTVIRNGELLEMQFKVTARQPLSNVILAIDVGYLRGVTVNTMMPAPDEERVRDGAYHLSFGPLDAGKALHFKIDGQINPSLVGSTHGSISVLDGDRRLAVLPMHLRVMP